MRLRNIPGSREMIAESEYVINEDEMYGMKGRWSEAFGNDHPIYLEIGIGKGRFITEMALQHRDRNYVGIEKYSSVLLKAVEKREQHQDLNNLLLLRMDAAELTEVFGPREISGIYLNFSDPWPKDRHAKRRLPGRTFLERYDRILTDDGRIEFKTDNHALFEFALKEASETGWHLDACTYDLHHDEDLMKDNIMTEYEEKFSSVGEPIYKMTISRENPDSQNTE